MRGVRDLSGTKPKTEPTELGMLLAELRQMRGLSQNALGELSGLTGSYINMLESGKRGHMVSRSTVLALAKGLGSMPSELDRLLVAAGMPLEKRSDRPGFEEIVARDPRLTPQQRKMLIDLYEMWTARPGTTRG